MKLKLFYIAIVLTNLTTIAQYSATGGTVTTTAIAGSTGSWGSLSNAVNDDDNRASNSSSLSGTQYTDYIVITNFGLSVPTSESITGVEFSINKSKSGGTWAYLGDYSVMLLKAGVMAGSDRASAFPWFNTDADFPYGSSVDLWGTTLTPTDVNHTGFGIAISAQRYFGFGNMTPRIDDVTVTVYAQAPLPVELTYFNAENLESSVLLNWTTNSEIENDRFEIQASRDGFIYQTIGEVQGQGNTAAVTTYSFADERVKDGVTYYRLKQVDFDGTTAYSEVKVIDRGIAAGDAVIYPNPATNYFSISNLPEGESTVEIYNMNGQLVKSEVVYGFSTIKTTDLGRGWYTVNIISETNTISQKLVLR